MPTTATATTDVDYWESDYGRNLKAGDVYCYADTQADGSEYEPDVERAYIVLEIEATPSGVLKVRGRHATRDHHGIWYVPADTRVYIGQRDENHVVCPTCGGEGRVAS